MVADVADVGAADPENAARESVHPDLSIVLPAERCAGGDRSPSTKQHVDQIEVGSHSAVHVASPSRGFLLHHPVGAEHGDGVVGAAERAQDLVGVGTRERGRSHLRIGGCGREAHG